MIPKNTTDVPDAELAVLQILWNSEVGLPVREIVLAIYGRHEHSLHASVKSFLDRLLEKGYVTVDKSGFAHTFSATLSREQFIGRQLKQIAESHFGGAMAPMLASLVDQVHLSRKDRAALQQVIERMKD